MKDGNLLAVAEGNCNHAVGVCHAISFLRLNILGGGSRAADIECDPICRISVQVDLCETTTENIHENASPIVGVKVSFEIALDKKITVSL